MWQIQIGTDVMYKTYVKSGSLRRYQCTFQEVTFPHSETTHKIVNKLRQSHYWTRRPNQNMKYSLNRNWMKLMLALNILLRNPPRHHAQGTRISKLSAINFQNAPKTETN
jgi:hypothetical protein